MNVLFFSAIVLIGLAQKANNINIFARWNRQERHCEERSDAAIRSLAAEGGVRWKGLVQFCVAKL